MGGVLRPILGLNGGDQKNIVLFRLTDDDAIWLADLEAGTVERTDAFEAGESDSSELRESTSRSRRTPLRAPSHLYYADRGAQA